MTKPKDRSIRIYLTEEEYQRLYTNAKELDICVTTYIYFKALDKPLKSGYVKNK